MSPFTALSVTGTPTASDNSLFSNPTNIPISWNTPTGSVGISIDLTTINPVLEERSESLGPSPPNPYTPRGRAKPDREAGGYLSAKTCSELQKICPEQAKTLRSAIDRARKQPTYENLAEWYYAVSKMGRPIEGCSDWTAEKQIHAQVFNRGIERAWEGHMYGIDWNTLQLDFNTMDKYLNGDGASEKPDVETETAADGPNVPESETSVEESKASYLELSMGSVLAGTFVAGLMALQ